MPDVSHIQLHARFKGRIFAGGHLPQSGYARRHFEALFMPRAVLFHVFKRMGARADQAHVALEDVPELRQFVQAVLAKKTA